MGRTPADLGIFIGKRLLQLVPVLLGSIVITFFVTHFGVSDPCAYWVPKAKPAALQACISTFGTSAPVTTQFVRYLTVLLQGNWGIDPTSGQPVWATITLAAPDTIELVLAALLLMVLIGIPLGVVAASNNGRLADHLVRIFYLSGWAVPTFLFALLLVYFAAPFFGLPSHGAFTQLNPPFPQYTHASVVDALLSGQPAYLADAVAHLILPALCLAFINMGIATRMTRATMLEVLPLDYVKTARMKGLSEFLVLYKHALRNSLITTVTVLGVTAGGLLSSTVVIEEVFNWPGIGRYSYTAVTSYDFPGVIAVVVVFSIGVVLANLAADILYGVLDPRVEWR
ncbi:MAG TPA: ABC transporter permease [Thermoplasmata archaeon]|nr:ABC transporter permease [Thermoplasmata archaeon]